MARRARSGGAGRAGRAARTAAAAAIYLCAAPAAAQQSPWSPSAGTVAALGLAAGPNPADALPIGPFLAYPKLTVGAVATDNLLASATNRVAALGISVAPSLSAVDDEDLHKTSLYFNADAQLYPGVAAPASRRAQAAILANADHLWSPTPDLKADVSLSYLRNDSPFAPAGGDGAAFVGSPLSVGASGSAQYFDVGSLDGWIEKSLPGGLMARAGAGAQDLVYERAPGSQAQGGRDYSAYLRLSYALSPTVQGFVEGGGDLRRYDLAASDANGTRVVVGLSSDLIGLTRGEVYAGVQRQTSATGAFGATNSPTFGALLAYYPTRALTLSLSASRALSSTLLAASPLLAAAAPSALTDEARAEVDYAIAEYWSASVRAGLARSTYRAPAAETLAVTLGAGLDYRFWRQAAVTLNYSYVRASARGAAGFTQNIATAGVTYRY